MTKLNLHTAAAAAAAGSHGVRGSAAERLIVHQRVVGSNPTARPHPLPGRFTGPARHHDAPAGTGTPTPR